MKIGIATKYVRRLRKRLALIQPLCYINTLDGPQLHIGSDGLPFIPGMLLEGQAFLYGPSSLVEIPQGLVR